MVNLAAEQLGPQFEDLLDRLDRGERITVTRDGRPVAILASLQQGELSDDPVANLRAMQREAVEHGLHRLSPEQVDQLISEARQTRTNGTP